MKALQIRRLIGLAAMAAASLAFWELSRKSMQLCDRFAASPEGRGNCIAVQDATVNITTTLFVIAMLVLTVLIVFPSSKKTGN